MKNELKNVVEARLRELNKLPTTLAKDAGLERNFINDILSGKKKSVRGPGLIKLAQALEMDVNHFVSAVSGAPLQQSGGGRDGFHSATPHQSDLVRVRVQGVARAGVFERVDELAEFDEVWIDEPRDEAFPEARLVAFDIAGDSLNALKPVPIPDGARVIGVDFDDLRDRVPLREGMVVVIEQTFADGQIREWSAKQIELHGERVEFHPRSTNPRYRPIVVNHDLFADDGRQVRILAIVRRITSEIPLSY